MCRLFASFSASTAMQFRERKVEDAANLIENNLMLLGATAIEDKLQEGWIFDPKNKIEN